VPIGALTAPGAGGPECESAPGGDSSNSHYVIDQQREFAVPVGSRSAPIRAPAEAKCTNLRKSLGEGSCLGAETHAGVAVADNPRNLQLLGAVKNAQKGRLTP